MSQPPVGAPPAGPAPRRGGGMGVLLTILIIVGAGGLLCCGVCAGVSYWGYSEGSKQLVTPVKARIDNSQEVKDALGEPLTAGLMTRADVVNTNATIEFPVTGPKGTGQVRAQLTTGVNGWEPTSIQVTPPGGEVIDVPTGDDPTQLNFDIGDDSEIKIDEE